jgi:hypothetical protein
VRVTALSMPHALWNRLDSLREPQLTRQQAAALTVRGRQLPLSGQQRQDWLKDRDLSLRALCGQTMVGWQTLERTALVLVSSGLPSDGGGAGEPAGRAPGVLFAATTQGGRILRGEQLQAVRRALLAFLRRNDLLNAPALIECEVDLPADGHEDEEPLALRDVPLLDLDGVRPVEAVDARHVLGTLVEAPNGRRWAVQPYVSEDNSRLQVFAALLANLSGVETLEMRLAAVRGGLIHAAMEVPDGLEVLLKPLDDPLLRGTAGNGIVTDAWLRNFVLYERPDRGIGRLDGRPMRMHSYEALQFRDWLPQDVVLTLQNLLNLQERSPFRPRSVYDTSLEQVAGNIRGILRVSDDVISELAERYGSFDARSRGKQVFQLIARRDVLGTLSFLDRTNQSFYEDGTAPRDIRGATVARIVGDEITNVRRETPQRVRVAPARARDHSGPRVPDAAVIDAVQRLVRDPEFLRAPMSRGGVRWVYPIPGHPFVFKFSRRGAEAVARWKQLFGEGRFPDSAMAEGEQYARKLNERTLLMVDHLGDDLVYAEHAMIIPDVQLPSTLLTGLEEHFVAGPMMTLPLLGTIQSIFPHIDAPGNLQCRFPYSEWNPAEPDRGASTMDQKCYFYGLYEWVLNQPLPYVGMTPIERIMRIHPRSTADVFLAECAEDPAMRALAKRFWTDLIARYCASTGESADTSGPENALWYLNAQGERKLALVDFLYPDDAPILLLADGLMRRFLRGEPLTVLEKAHLLNAINFARGANFMASQLEIKQRIDLFPDDWTKQQIWTRSADVFELLNTIRFERLQPRPDSPWGIY